MWWFHPLKIQTEPAAGVIAASRVEVGVSHHQNDLLRKRSRDGSSVQAYSYGVPGDCLRRADASFTPIHEV